jgi:hypothetical protein
MLYFFGAFIIIVEIADQKSGSNNITRRNEKTDGVNFKFELVLLRKYISNNYATRMNEQQHQNKKQVILTAEKANYFFINAKNKPCNYSKAQLYGRNINNGMKGKWSIGC